MQARVLCVDLFCGAGGLTCGLLQGGIHVVAGVDADPACRYPYEANNGVPFLQRDIAGMDADEVSELFPPGAIKVLAGCAPCQPFSTVNPKRGSANDPRRTLMGEFARIVQGAMPDYVVMENVPLVRKHPIFLGFVAELERLGYHVWHSVVDCADYGVPQHRKRLILLAALCGGHLELVEPPFANESHRTVRQAIGHLPLLAAGEADPHDPIHKVAGLTPRNLERIRASKPGGTWRDWPDHLVSPGFRNPKHSFPDVYGRMEWDKPAPTITTHCYNFSSGRFGHPEQDRAISLREAALLQDFPLDYAFVEPGAPVHLRTVGKLIGNAVPPGLGRAIAESIIRHLKQHGLSSSSERR